jgi:hypothetical protein
MKKPTNGAIAAMIAVLVSVICGAAPVMAQQPQNPAPIPGGQCCGMSPWGSGPTLTAPGYEEVIFTDATTTCVWRVEGPCI